MRKSFVSLVVSALMLSAVAVIGSASSASAGSNAPPTSPGSVAVRQGGLPQMYMPPFTPMIWPVM